MGSITFIFYIYVKFYFHDFIHWVSAVCQRCRPYAVMWKTHQDDCKRQVTQDQSCALHRRVSFALNLWQVLRAQHIPLPDGCEWVIKFNTFRTRQNGRHFADDMFKCIFLNENVWIPIEISLKFVPKGSINNNPALFQIMAWHHPGDKPLSEPIMVSSLTHMCHSASMN